MLLVYMTRSLGSESRYLLLGACVFHDILVTKIVHEELRSARRVTAYFTRGIVL